MKTRRLFWKSISWEVADGFDSVSASKIEVFINKREKDGEEGWKHVQTMDIEEALHCSLFLRSQREEMNPSLRQLKFLYETYEPRCWWFEVFETVRRLLLTGGLVLFNPGTSSQIVASLIICLLSVRVYSGYDPFIDEKHDRLVEVAQWQLFFTLLGSLCIRVKIYTGKKNKGYNAGPRVSKYLSRILICQ